MGETNFHLWFGTGFHFALEDYHGYRDFDSPIEAFKAYYAAFREEELPPDAEESLALSAGMLDHYTNHWLKHRGGEYKTLYFKGKPQVEVDFTMTLPALSKELGTEVKYKGTFDRVVEDSNGDLWVEDYKTASRIDTSKLETDPQISMYKWAAESWFGTPIEGVLYTQFLKDVPKQPRVLKNGSLSVDKRQKTTHDLYREELLERYPDGDFPQKYVEMLGVLAEKEAPEGDQFIRRDQVWRNSSQAEAEYKHMCQEIIEMHRAINEDVLYPNQTRDCAWDCDFRTVCIAMDDGSDADHLLRTMYEEQPPRDERPWKLVVNDLRKELRGEKEDNIFEM